LFKTTYMMNFFLLHSILHNLDINRMIISFARLLTDTKDDFEKWSISMALCCGTFACVSDAGIWIKTTAQQPAKNW